MMAEPRQNAKRRDGKKMKRQICWPTVVQITVLIWSGGILTAGWIGVLKNADTTFTAGIFTSILANFGVNRKQEQQEEENTEKESTRTRETEKTKVEPKPEATTVIRSSKTQP